MEELVNVRKEVGVIFNDVASPYFDDLILPQKMYANSTNSYWTWVAKLNTEKVSWKLFRSKYLELGGAPFYGAWKLTYLEPMFANMELLGREKFISNERKSEYKMVYVLMPKKFNQQLCNLRLIFGI